ncbi:MAG TPA: 30S ribosomal protein S3 [Thermoplasmata archaeon]|jgi:small subunit ribosomal protein S3|nr:30S ribosomal protein S3 [Thermoplasmata archaeon]
MSAEQKVIQEAMRRVLLKDYLVQESARAGFGGLDITRTPMGTRVTLICERPGILIGHRGELIKRLTEDIQHRFRLDNPQIEVQEERQPSLNAQLMSEKLASTLERGWHFRRAGHSTVRRIMEAGARGCQVILSGKLTGERHRTERFKAGTIKYCGEAVHLWIDKGFYQARLKPGVIGVNVWIMRPAAKLPDEIVVRGVEMPPKIAPAELPPLEEAPGVPPGPESSEAS